MTVAEAERIVRDALLSSDEGINGEVAFDFLLGDLIAAQTELARKDEALRKIAAWRGVGLPGPVAAEIARAALGEQP